MTTLQEQFEKDFLGKGAKRMEVYHKYKDSNFTNYDLDLREYKNLTHLYLGGNQLTSIGFLNQLPNPEKLELLEIFNNNIQPTDIEMFSKFINLETLRIGTMEESLKIDRHNKFYGSLKSYQNLTKLKSICIEATDVNEGLEYLPESLARQTKERRQYAIECSPHDTNAKCKAIQDQLRPFNYDLEAWQLAHPEKMLISRPEYFTNPDSKEKWINALTNKITQTQQELQTVREHEADKTKKIERLESKLQLLQETHDKLEKELAQEQQQHNQTKTNFQSQLRDLATILFPSNSDFSNLSFSALKDQIEKTKKEQQEIHLKNQEQITNLNQEKVKLQSQLISKDQELTRLIHNYQTKFLGQDTKMQNILNQAKKDKEDFQGQVKDLKNQIQELKSTKPTIHQQTQTDFLMQEKRTRNEVKKVTISCEVNCSTPLTEEEKKWEVIKVGIEKETDLTRLANGAYWDTQIQNLSDNSLPANKQSIVLKNRLQQQEKQLKREKVENKQERQVESKIELNPSKIN